MRKTHAALVTILTVAPLGVQTNRAAEHEPVATALRTGNSGASSADRVERATANIRDTRPDASSAAKIETAVFAGGCFWCTELAFEQLRGVRDVESGYCGGTRNTANYDRVHRGATGHAEAIRVTYDPGKISYEQLLEVFFDAHDPTQFNRQDEDTGRQYRSAIFFADDGQKKQAEAKIADLQRKHLFARRIVTRIEPLTTFYPAEEMHQNFARKYPYLTYVQDHAIPKACNVRIKHPELIGPSP